MASQPKVRSHKALKFAASVVRLGSILVGGVTILISVSLAGAANTATKAAGDLGLGQLGTGIGAAGGLLALLVAAIGLTYATMMWAVADVFVLLADGDDVQRGLAFHVARLAAAATPARPAFAPIEPTESAAPPRFAIVGAAPLRLFAAPERTAPTIGRAEAGTRFELLGERGEFVAVRGPGGTTAFLPRIAVRVEV